MTTVRQDELDVKELGRRLAIIRKKLDMTQSEVAEEVGTSQYQISKIECGGKCMSSLLLKLLVFYGKSISLDKLLGKTFDEQEKLTSSQYALNTIVKAKLVLLKEELVRNLTESQNEITKQLEEASNLL